MSSINELAALGDKSSGSNKSGDSNNSDKSGDYLEVLAELGLVGLFLSAFLAATILPLSSELVLSAIIAQGADPALAITIASIGNVLGAVVNYGLGYWLAAGLLQGGFLQTRIGQRWRLSDAQYQRAQARFQRFGLWSLCLAWVPIIGDPLTVVAGAMRVSLIWFLVLVSLGKIARYVVVAYLAGYFLV